MNFNIESSIHNRFGIEVVDAKTGEIKNTFYAENTILNSFWEKIFSQTNAFRYIHLGTGTGVINVTDTSLFTFLAQKTAVRKNDKEYFVSDPKNGIAWATKTCQILESEYVGYALTEIGVAYGNTASTLVTKAMIKDMSGNQVSINKLSTDIINITATIYCHWNTDGYSSPFGRIRIVGDLYNGFVGSFLTGASTSGFVSTYGSVIDTTTSYVPNATSPLAAAIYGTGGIVTLGSTTSPTMGPNYKSTWAKQIPLESSNFTFDISKLQLQVIIPRLAATEGNLDGGIDYIALCDRIVRSTGGSITYYGARPTVVAEFTNKTNFVAESDIIGTGDGVTKTFRTTYEKITNPEVSVDNIVVDPSTYTIDENAISYPWNIGKYFIPDEESMGYQPCLPCRKPGYDATMLYVRSPQIYYNPYYQIGVDVLYVDGIVGITGYKTEGLFEFSNDKINWKKITVNEITGMPDLNFHDTTFKGKYEFGADLKNFKYVRINVTDGTYLFVSTSYTGGQITFNEPPAIGVPIMASYQTACIPKDVNHVLDVTFTFTFKDGNGASVLIPNVNTFTALTIDAISLKKSYTAALKPVILDAGSCISATLEDSSAVTGLLLEV